VQSDPVINDFIIAPQLPDFSNWLHADHAGSQKHRDAFLSIFFLVIYIALF